MKDPYCDLVFLDPRRYLQFSIVRAGQISIRAEIATKSPKARRPETKADLEPRQAALFAYGRSVLAADPDLRVAMGTNQNDSVDAVIRTKAGSEAFAYERVQLKELVPDEVDGRQTMARLMKDIERCYCSGEVLTIAIHLNRDAITHLGEIKGPNLRGVSFWFFGLCGVNRGFLARDPFLDFKVFEFDFPKMPTSLTEL